MAQKKIERIRKLRALTVERGATEAEAETATRIADELEATLNADEKENLHVETSKAWIEEENYEYVETYNRATVYRPRVWYADDTGGIYTKNNPVPSTGFAERLRKRSPFG